MESVKSCVSIKRPIEIKNKSLIYVKLDQSSEYIEPIYIKFFSKVGEFFFNCTGNYPFAPHTRCYKVEAGKQYACEIYFDRKAEYSILAYDSKGQKIENGKWKSDINEYEIGLCDRTLRIQDTINKGYDTKYDHVHDLTPTKKPTKIGEEPNIIGIAPFNELSRDSTKFVIIDIPGPYRAFEWFEGSRMTNEIYNFVRLMSDYHSNDDKFLLFDNDTRKVVPKYVCINEALLPKNKGAARVRFSLKTISNQDEDDNKSSQRLPNEMVSYNQITLTKNARTKTEKREKVSNGPAYLLITKITPEAKVQVEVHGCIRNDGPNLSTRGTEFVNGFIINKEGKYQLENIVSESGFESCYISFLSLSDEDITIDYGWSPFCVDYKGVAKPEITKW